MPLCRGCLASQATMPVTLPAPAGPEVRPLCGACVGFLDADLSASGVNCPGCARLASYVALTVEYREQARLFDTNPPALPEARHSVACLLPAFAAVG